jgi:hypothetical protein
MHQFVWAHRDADTTEQSVPMLWHGQHLRRMGWSNPIVLVFLEGLDRLSSGYTKQLEKLGYEILDCRALAADMVRDIHPRLGALPTTDKYWFLRWSVLGALSKTEVIRGQAIHIDGDLVFTSAPAELEQDVAGKTFILQGNPHFGVISAPHWFDVWQTELNMFLEHRTEYIANALREKRNPAFPPREFCNVCAYGPTRFQDQDLIEYLIAAGRLPQARTRDVFNSRFYWMQNPLMPGEWFEEQRAGEDRRVVEEGSNSLIGRKPLAYYHFLTGFIKYCDVWLDSYTKGAEQSLDSAEFLGKLKRTSALRTAARYVALSLLKLRRVTKRRYMYEPCFTRNPQTGNLFVTDIVNSCWGSQPP